MQIIKDYTFHPGTFFTGSRKALQDTELSDGALRLYLVLCNNQHGFVTNKTALMKRCAAKRMETLNRRIVELQERGYLTIDGEQWILCGNNVQGLNISKELIKETSWWHVERDEIKFIILEVLLTYEITFHNRELNDSLRITCVNKRIPPSTMKSIKEFINYFPEKQDRINYIDGLSRDKNFWNNPARIYNPLYSIFMFKSSTIEQRFAKALNLLGVKQKEVVEPSEPVPTELTKEEREEFRKQAKSIVKKMIVTDNELSEWIRLNTNYEEGEISKKEMMQIYKDHLESAEYNRLTETL